MWWWFIRSLVPAILLWISSVQAWEPYLHSPETYQLQIRGQTTLGAHSRQPWVRSLSLHVTPNTISWHFKTQWSGLPHLWQERLWNMGLLFPVRPAWFWLLNATLAQQFWPQQSSYQAGWSSHLVLFLPHHFRFQMGAQQQPRDFHSCSYADFSIQWNLSTQTRVQFIVAVNQIQKFWILEQNIGIGEHLSANITYQSESKRLHLEMQVYDFWSQRHSLHPGIQLHHQLAPLKTLGYQYQVMHD